MVLDQTIPHIGEFTKIPFNLFFVIGFCVLRWQPNERPRALQLFFRVNLVMLLTSIVGMVAYLKQKSMETSLERVAYIIYVTFAGSSLLKLVCCFYNIKKLCRVLKSFEKYYPKTVEQRQAYELDEHLKTMRKYNLGLTIYHFAVTSMFNIFALIQNIFIYYQRTERVFLYDLPFPVYYYINTKTTVRHTLIYCSQCISSYTTSCAFLGSDLLLITCIHLINMNFKYLAKSVRDFRPTGGPSDVKKLNSFIIFHNDILRSVELLDETFNISIFLNYLSTVGIIGLIGFQLVVGDNYLDLVKFVAFLISTLTHVYFISVFGTEMIARSSVISEAFMHHPWYDAHIEYQRAILIPIAQKPVHLNGFKFFIVSMETFKSLVSISYQIFTLIKTTYVD